MYLGRTLLLIFICFLFGTIDARRNRNRQNQTRNIIESVREATRNETATLTPEAYTKEPITDGNTLSDELMDVQNATVVTSTTSRPIMPETTTLRSASGIEPSITIVTNQASSLSSKVQRVTENVTVTTTSPSPEVSEAKTETETVRQKPESLAVAAANGNNTNGLRKWANDGPPPLSDPVPVPSPVDAQTQTQFQPEPPTQTPSPIEFQTQKPLWVPQTVPQFQPRPAPALQTESLGRPQSPPQEVQGERIPQTHPQFQAQPRAKPATVGAQTQTQFQPEPLAQTPSPIEFQTQKPLWIPPFQPRPEPASQPQYQGRPQSPLQELQTERKPQAQPHFQVQPRAEPAWQTRPQILQPKPATQTLSQPQGNHQSPAQKVQKNPQAQTQFSQFQPGPKPILHQTPTLTNSQSRPNIPGKFQESIFGMDELFNAAPDSKLKRTIRRRLARIEEVLERLYSVMGKTTNQLQKCAQTSRRGSRATDQAPSGSGVSWPDSAAPAAPQIGDENSNQQSQSGDRPADYDWERYEQDLGLNFKVPQTDNSDYDWERYEQNLGIDYRKPAQGHNPNPQPKPASSWGAIIGTGAQVFPGDQTGGTDQHSLNYRPQQNSQINFNKDH